MSYLADHEEDQPNHDDDHDDADPHAGLEDVANQLASCGQNSGDERDPQSVKANSTLDHRNLRQCARHSGLNGAQQRGSQRRTDELSWQLDAGSWSL